MELKKHYKLKEICEVKSGNSKLTSQYLKNNPGPYLVFDSSKEGYCKGNWNQFDFNGEYIYFISNAQKNIVGKFFYFNNLKFSVYVHAKVLNNFKIKLNLRYLYFYFTQLNKLKYLTASGTQLRSEDAVDIDVFLPSLNTQNYFVKKLWFLEESFKELKKLKIQLQNIKRKLLRYCFGKYLNQEKDLQCKLKEVCVVKTGDSKLSKAYCEKNKGSYPVYSSSNMGPLAYISTYQHKGNFIWMIKVGPPYQGKSFYIENQKFSLTSLAFLLKIKKSEKNLDLKYLYFYLLFQQKNIQHILTVGTALKRINIDNLQKYFIQIPSLSIQSKIINFLSSYDLIDPLILKIDNFLNSYNSYKKTILKILFAI